MHVGTAIFFVILALASLIAKPFGNFVSCLKTKEKLVLKGEHALGRTRENRDTRRFRQCLQRGVSGHLGTYHVWTLWHMLLVEEHLIKGFYTYEYNLLSMLQLFYSGAIYEMLFLYI